jgi:hypothetical protein
MGPRRSFLICAAAAVALAAWSASCSSGNKKQAGGVTCRNSLDCPVPMVCDMAIAMCVECVTVNDCPAKNDCTARTCVPYVTCKNSLDCRAPQVCDTASGRCVACVTDADCADATKICVARACQTKCMSDRTCTPMGLLCDLTTSSCVRCLKSQDCPSGQYCQGGACLAAVCAPGQTACMLNAVATCNAVGDGYVGTAAPCDPKTCVMSASGAACVAAAADGGAGAGGAAGGGGTGTGGAGTGGVGTGTGGAGTGGAGGGGVLFFDDFESGASRWTPSTPSDWTITTDGSSVYNQGNAAVDNLWRMSGAGDAAWTDVAVEAKVKWPTGTPGTGASLAAVAARYQDATDFYWGGIGLSAPGMESVFIRRRQGAVSTYLAMMTPPMATAGAWHTVKLQVVGSTLTMFLDGVQMLTATDGTFTAGKIGVGSFNMNAEFDDVRVTAP